MSNTDLAPEALYNKDPTNINISQFYEKIHDSIDNVEKILKIDISTAFDNICKLQSEINEYSDNVKMRSKNLNDYDKLSHIKQELKSGSVQLFDKLAKDDNTIMACIDDEDIKVVSNLYINAFDDLIKYKIKNTFADKTAKIINKTAQIINIKQDIEKQRKNMLFKTYFKNAKNALDMLVDALLRQYKNQITYLTSESGLNMIAFDIVQMLYFNEKTACDYDIIPNGFAFIEQLAPIIEEDCEYVLEKFKLNFDKNHKLNIDNGYLNVIKHGKIIMSLTKGNIICRLNGYFNNYHELFNPVLNDEKIKNKITIKITNTSSYSCISFEKR